MKISYDYEKEIDEIKSDIEGGTLSLDDKMHIVREDVSAKAFGKVVSYPPIVDWIEIEFADEQKRKLPVLTVREILAEMEEYNKIN